MARSGQTVMGHHPVLREAYPHLPPFVEHQGNRLSPSLARLSFPQAGHSTAQFPKLAIACIITTERLRLCTIGRPA